jgi:uncharacterized protein DUF4124
MNRFFGIFFVAILAVSFSTVYAATYSWTDEKGTIHFTENPGKVPEKFRNKVKIEDGADSAPEEKPATKEPAANVPDATPRAVYSGGDAGSGIYAGKTYDEWQKDLADREAAMFAARKRIDEIAALLNKFTGGWDEQKKLLLEYNSLSTQLKEMKAQYFQQVEIARKAGLTIDVQQ